MAVDASGIRGFFGRYVGTPANRQDQAQNQQKGPLEGDALAARIGSMPLDEQAALAMALKTGDVGASASASAANEVYGKAENQAKLIAQQYGLQPDTDDYNEFVNNYAQQFYNENIGQGVVSYQQAVEMNKLYQQREADKVDSAYQDYLRSKGQYAGHVGADKWMDDFTGWLRQTSSNPRVQDIADHLSTSGTTPYDTTKYSPSNNPYTRKQEYENEFWDYYNNQPKG